jgi:hypothetical protein
VNTIVARFRTHELAMRAYFDLELAVRFESLPSLDEDGGGRPWTLTISYDRDQQPLVLRTVGDFGGVTYQEHEEDGVR